MQVITATKTLKSQPFNPVDDPIATGQAWDEWEFRYFKITEPLNKKDALIIYGGKEIARLEKSLPHPTDGGDNYGQLRKKLNDYFKPKKNKHHARYVFLKMRLTQKLCLQSQIKKTNKYRKMFLLSNLKLTKFLVFFKVISNLPLYESGAFRSTWRVMKKLSIFSVLVVGGTVA